MVDWIQSLLDCLRSLAAIATVIGLMIVNFVEAGP